MSPADALPGLWDFCLELYAQPEIEALCLRLQDEHQVNVLVLLWCAWLEVTGAQLTREQLAAAAEQTMGASEQTLVPLRQVRRHIKNAGTFPTELVETVKEDVLRAELALEKYLLRKLEMARPSSGCTAASPPLDALVAECRLEDSETWLGSLRRGAEQAMRSL